jgi:hypothetical protein
MVVTLINKLRIARLQRAYLGERIPPRRTILRRRFHTVSPPPTLPFAILSPFRVWTCGRLVIRLTRSFPIVHHSGIDSRQCGVGLALPKGDENICASRGHRYIVLFVPTLNKIGGSTEIDLNDIVCQFAFNMEDSYVVYGFIGTPKFEKHILPVNFDPAVDGKKKTTQKWHLWGIINPLKSKHTALAPAGFGAIRPLYELFARDFIGEFRKQQGEERKRNNRELKAWNAELKYKRQELGGYVPRGIDVGKSIDIADDQFQFLRVGAIVKILAAGEVKQSPVAGPNQDGSIPVVFFQHGPLVE